MKRKERLQPGGGIFTISTIYRDLKCVIGCAAKVVNAKTNTDQWKCITPAIGREGGTHLGLGMRAQECLPLSGTSDFILLATRYVV